MFIFFFQAEDGIRDIGVTGVQTCALPIYGPINRVCLNMGYHNEHHDLPSIPWNNLPKLRALAPEFYDCLKYHPSWSGLLFQFIFDKRYTLFSRIERMKKSRDSAATVRGAALNRRKAIAVEPEIAGV